jgi:hypothetical protein
MRHGTLWNEKMKRIDLIIIPSAIGIGALLAYSTGRWISAADAGTIQVRQAKKELIECGDLFKLHCDICDKVGRHTWETSVKPDFMMAITYATIMETGNPLPDWPDIVKWTREHPEDAHRIMEEAARNAVKP